MPEEERMSDGALSGVQVLDLSVDYAGALVAMTLADHGAEVIRISSEGALERTFAHRGKVRISSGENLGELLSELLEKADVVIEDAPIHQCRAREITSDPSRGQIHCWVPAFPADHPEARVRGLDGITQAYMGIYEVPLGRKPAYHSLSILPVTAAAYASCGVLAALIAKERDGLGQRVEVSRAMTAYAVLELNAMFTVGAPRSWATLQWASTPFIDGYPTADGEWIYIHAGLAGHLPRLLDVLEREAPRQTRKLRNKISEQTMQDPTSVPGVREVSAIRKGLSEIFAIRPAIVWEGRLSRAGLCAVVARMPQAWREHDHARASGQVIEHEGKLMPGSPTHLDRRIPTLRKTRAVSTEEASKMWTKRAVSVEGEDVSLPPLHGIRVLDFTQVIAGPTATRTLAELGASVHRVENPRFGAPWVEPFHIAYNAGKTSETINLKSTVGSRALREVFDSYAPDVVVQNFRPGAAKQLELDERRLREKFPSLIYAHLTAYGTEGPWGDRPGWEQTAQAACGIQRTWGGPSGPSLFPLPFNDLCTGVYGALGVLLALYRRQKSGEGGSVSACLSSTATMMQARTMFDRAPLVRGESQGVAPEQRFYQARDGWFFLSATSIEALWNIPGLELARGSSGEALELSLEMEFRRYNLQNWRERITSAGLDEQITLISRRAQRAVLNDPYAKRHGLVERRAHEGVGDVTETRSPLILERTPCVELSPAPLTERPRDKTGLVSWLSKQVAGAAALATNNPKK